MVQFDPINSDMNNAVLPFRELLQKLLTRFTTHPERIQIEAETSANGKHVYLAVKGHPDDQGLLIGSAGDNARSISTLLRMAGLTTGHTVSYKVLEPEVTERSDIKQFEEDPNFNETKSEELRNLLNDVLGFVTTAKFSTMTHNDPESRATTYIITVDNGVLPLPAEYALNKVFRAIGRKQGRKVCVNVRHIQKIQIPNACKACRR